MINWIRKPNSVDIAQYVDCYWLIQKKTESELHQYPKLNPDPNAHLIISPADQAFHHASSQQSFTGVGSHWLWPHQHTYQLDHRKAFIHLGIKFQIGALYSLDCLTAEPMTSPIDDVSPISLAALLNNTDADENQLITLALDDPDKCTLALDRLFLAWIKNNKEDKHSQLTRKIIPLLIDNAISDLGDKLFCSQRTVERSFNRVTGLTLKQCQSMLKFDEILEYLYQRESKDIDWVEVALKFGFSDQPHLIRHLKKQIGVTPSAYVKDRDLTIDVYGGISPT
ncbi:helix-turn-helix domain-containing protein [Shewanella donghaensis]|uniref:helix-turn-helix domain-containing protein n=1 Tax=Shewanella donghaensis TaxID=238836 RepID=UPI00118459BD|nr:helix-turn-helix domain-containing protein [Shewanella donghaensis]